MFSVNFYNAQSLLISWPEEVSIDLDKKIKSFIHTVGNLNNLLEVVQGYSSLLLVFNSQESCINCKSIIDNWDPSTEIMEAEKDIVEIEVCYDLKLAPDIVSVSAKTGLSLYEIIDIHSSPLYYVHFIGFMPGFGYMSGLSEKLNTSRKQTPENVIAGSIGIAGNQTAIYPFTSPGGWNIIGRTYRSMFNNQRNSPTLLKAGSYVKFIPISYEVYDKKKY